VGNFGWPSGAQQAALSLPSVAGQGRENITKGLWVKLRTGRSLTYYHHRQTRLDLGQLISFITYQIGVGNEK